MSLIKIPEYEFISKNRNEKMGGGVEFFIHKSINFLIREDLKMEDEVAECLTIEIINSNSKNIVICLIYRPPNTDPIKFINCLSTTIECLRSSKKITYLMGDFNIYLLKNDICNIRDNFTNMLHSYNFFPLINTPTRVTETSSTLIDNIFSHLLTDHTNGVIC